MYIKHLSLHHFRNYDKENIDFGKGLNIIHGKNAQGKTNILEAIYICACARSHRTSKDYNLVKENEDSFKITVDYIDDDDVQRDLEILYDKLKRKKSLKLNSINQKRIGELIGNLNVIFFAPEDLMIVKSGPSIRRRNIDISLSQIKPSYFYDLSQYHKILIQKNKLLKKIKENSRLLETLDVWSEKLAFYAAKIIIKRKLFMKDLTQKIQSKHLLISKGLERIEIKYITSLKDYEKMTEEEISSRLLELYKENREKEIMYGSTFIGPHRDDYSFYINNMSAKNFASQGQQRSLVLSYKLAELEIMKEQTQNQPILLLDDVLSELDENRRESLYNSLDNIQTFITCTKKTNIDNNIFEKINYYHIEDGRVRME